MNYLINIILQLFITFMIIKIQSEKFILVFYIQYMELSFNLLYKYYNYIKFGKFYDTFYQNFKFVE
jgi:hypothetical protein